VHDKERMALTSLLSSFNTISASIVVASVADPVACLGAGEGVWYWDKYYYSFYLGPIMRRIVQLHLTIHGKWDISTMVTLSAAGQFPFWLAIDVRAQIPQYPVTSTPDPPSHLCKGWGIETTPVNTYQFLKRMACFLRAATCQVMDLVWLTSTR